jgi:hypothetical protein
MYELDAHEVKMPYQYSEYIPKHVLYFRVWGEFTPDDTIGANQDSLNYLDKSNHPVHFITDFRQMTAYPLNLRVLTSTFTLFAHPKIGWEIIITQDKLVKFFSMMVAQTLIRGKNRQALVKVVNSPEEALRFLAHIAPELGELKALPETFGV